MRNRRQEAARWLTRQRRQHTSEAAVYRRGAEAVSIAGTFTSAVQAADVEQGIVLPEDALVCLIAAEDLVLAGQQATPEDGDQIDRHHAQQVTTYRVTKPRGGKQCYRADAHGAQLAVYLVKVEV